MAAAMSDIDLAQQERLRSLLQTAGLPIAPPAISPAQLREAMQLDKKVQAKKIRLVLLHKLGDAYLSSDYSEQRLDAVLSGADG